MVTLILARIGLSFFIVIGVVLSVSNPLLWVPREARGTHWTNLDPSLIFAIAGWHVVSTYFQRLFVPIIALVGLSFGSTTIQTWSGYILIFTFLHIFYMVALRRKSLTMPSALVTHFTHLGCVIPTLYLIYLMFASVYA